MCDMDKNKNKTRLNKGDCGKNPAPDFHRRYCGIVGSLEYLVTMSRPDLAWAYFELSKYVQFPGGKSHARRLTLFSVLGIKRFATLVTLTKKLTFCGAGWMRIGPEITHARRSHTGYILMMNSGPIAWNSRRQNNVSLSTSEAEYVEASQAGNEAMYLREKLTDFGYS